MVLYLSKLWSNKVIDRAMCYHILVFTVLKERRMASSQKIHQGRCFTLNLPVLQIPWFFWISKKDLRNKNPKPSGVLWKPKEIFKIAYSSLKRIRQDLIWFRSPKSMNWLRWSMERFFDTRKIYHGKTLILHEKKTNSETAQLKVS